MVLTLVILAFTFLAMASGKIRSDMVAIATMLCFMLGGILTPQEALSGFANTVIFVMAGMFIISRAIVRCGLAAIISARILGIAGKNTNILFFMIMMMTALIGSLVSNTGTVAIMMPIVVSLSLTIDESPSRFLLPLAFMSSIGGMTTMLGNSSNMVVNDAYVRAGYPSLNLFSFLPVGLVCLLFGMLILAPITSRYLSRRKNSKFQQKSSRFSMRKLAERYKLAENTYILAVPADSPVIATPLASLGLPENYGIVVTDVMRSETPTGPFHFANQRTTSFLPGPETMLQGGDRIRVIGSVSGVKTLMDDADLHMDTAAATHGDESVFTHVGICELVVMSSSRLVNRTVADTRLRRQFGITVLGIQRGDRYIIEDVKDQPIQAGDALLVQGTWDNLSHLEEQETDWVVVGRPQEQARSGLMKHKIPLVVAVVGTMLFVTAFGLMPIVTAVLLAAMALILGGCFRNMDEVYSALNWETVVMLACLLPMSLAMEKTGIVAAISGKMVSMAHLHGPYIALAVIYLISSSMNVVISTTPVTLLVTPIAVQIAESLGLDPLPFLVAVTTGASLCFASPFSTPSNALVMSAGRYTFSDYLRVGLPLQALMAVVMIITIPLLYSFGT